MEAGVNPAQACPYCKRGQGSKGHCSLWNEKAFPRVIRSQDTCSLFKSDDSWVGELAFFIAVFCLLSPFCCRGKVFYFSQKGCMYYRYKKSRRRRAPVAGAEGFCLCKWTYADKK